MPNRKKQELDDTDLPAPDLKRTMADPGQGEGDGCEPDQPMTSHQIRVASGGNCRPGVDPCYSEV